MDGTDWIRITHAHTHTDTDIYPHDCYTPSLGDSGCLGDITSNLLFIKSSGNVNSFSSFGNGRHSFSSYKKSDKQLILTVHQELPLQYEIMSWNARTVSCRKRQGRIQGGSKGSMEPPFERASLTRDTLIEQSQ